MCRELDGLVIGRGRGRGGRNGSHSGHARAYARAARVVAPGGPDAEPVCGAPVLALVEVALHVPPVRRSKIFRWRPIVIPL